MPFLPRYVKGIESIDLFKYCIEKKNWIKLFDNKFIAWNLVEMICFDHFYLFIEESFILFQYFWFIT